MALTIGNTRQNDHSTSGENRCTLKSALETQPLPHRCPLSPSYMGKKSLDYDLVRDKRTGKQKHYT